LQDTVNGLLSIVGAGQQIPQEQAAAFIPSPSSLGSSSHARSPHPGDNRRTQLGHLPVTHLPTHDLAGHSSSLSTVHESVPFLNNSDILLSIFHNRLAAQVPFVVIPSHMTTEDLHREKPMVYMTIMMAASYADMTTQQELGKVVLTYLTQKAIFEGKKSLDLLQGLLLYISWSVYSWLWIVVSQPNAHSGINIFVTSVTR
jgi:hypothetical protein